MQFIWDEAKNETNIEKHGFDFNDAKEIFQGLMLIYEDTRQNYEKPVCLAWVFWNMTLWSSFLPKKSAT